MSTKLVLIQGEQVSLYHGRQHVATWAYVPPLIKDSVDFILSMDPRTLTPMRNRPGGDAA